VTRHRRGQGRQLRRFAALVVALVAILAIDCSNASGEWSWVDLGHAPHLAVVKPAAASTAARPVRPSPLHAAVLPVSIALSALLAGVVLAIAIAPPTGVGRPRRHPARAPPLAFALARAH